MQFAASDKDTTAGLSSGSSPADTASSSMYTPRQAGQDGARNLESSNSALQLCKLML